MPTGPQMQVYTDAGVGILIPYGTSNLPVAYPIIRFDRSRQLLHLYYDPLRNKFYSSQVETDANVGSWYGSGRQNFLTFRNYLKDLAANGYDVFKTLSMGGRTSSAATGAGVIEAEDAEDISPSQAIVLAAGKVPAAQRALANQRQPSAQIVTDSSGFPLTPITGETLLGLPRPLALIGLVALAWVVMKN